MSRPALPNGAAPNAPLNSSQFNPEDETKSERMNIVSQQLDSKGWKVDLFLNKNEIQSYFCGLCGNVAKDAMINKCDRKYHLSPRLKPLNAAINMSADNDDNSSDNDDDNESNDSDSDCSHTVLYCADCITDYLRNNNGKCCVNNHLNPKFEPISFARRQILSFKVRCIHSHFFRKQSLAIPIGNIIVSSDGIIEGTETVPLISNKRNDESKMEQSSLTDHCTTVGCDWIGRLGKLSSHMTQGCDYKPLHCPFREFGCRDNDSFIAADIPMHKKTYMAHHLDLLLNHISSQNGFISSLMTRIESLELRMGGNNRSNERYPMLSNLASMPIHTTLVKDTQSPLNSTLLSAAIDCDDDTKALSNESDNGSESSPEIDFQLDANESESNASQSDDSNPTHMRPNPIHIWRFDRNACDDIIVSRKGMRAETFSTDWSLIAFGAPLSAIPDNVCIYRIRFRMEDANQFFYPYLSLIDETDDAVLYISNRGVGLNCGGFEVETNCLRFYDSDNCVIEAAIDLQSLSMRLTNVSTNVEIVVKNIRKELSIGARMVAYAKSPENVCSAVEILQQKWVTL